MKRLIIIFMLVSLFISTRIGFTQENKVDLNALIEETQKRSSQADEMTFVWWIPEEYWRVSFANNPAMTQAQVEQFISVFRPYTLIAVVDGRVSTYGAISYKSELEVRSYIKIRDNQGNVYSAFSETEIIPEAKIFLSMMKPTLTNILGPMGQNMHFFLFPAKNKDGQAIADAKKEGTFSVILGVREFRWKLPLSSLLPLKICPTCKEKLPGAYKFCPWDGTKLE